MGLESRKHFRKRKAHEDDEDDDDSADVRSTVEEVKLLQRQRERTKGVVAEHLAQPAAPPKAVAEQGLAEEGNEELVLQDTFAQETAVTVEDPNMLKYIEQELAKKRGVNISNDNNATPTEDELYAIPEHLKVKRSSNDEGSTAWTTGIAEIQLPIEYKVKNIEETEAAKKALQERRPFVGRGRAPQTTLPASYSADYFQRGREYAEKLRREHPDLYKDNQHGSGKGTQAMAGAPGPAAPAGFQGDPQGEGASGNSRRQAATDEIMLERFRKRERNRLRR